MDLVVLSATEVRPAYATEECDSLLTLRHVNSCETVTITEEEAADRLDVAEAVRRAEVVYFAGGDQCHYVAWNGSAVHRAVQEVVARGGVGGGSAGLAIHSTHHLPLHGPGCTTRPFGKRNGADAATDWIDSRSSRE